MQKGMTLVELLIGLAIISIVLNFAVPLWKTDSPKTILAKEQHRLYLFLRPNSGSGRKFIGSVVFTYQS